MGRITVNIEALRNDASALLKQISAIEAEQARLIALIAKIADSWEGAASKALIKKIEKEIETSKKVIALLKKYKRYIDMAISRFENSDSSSSKKINNSF